MEAAEALWSTGDVLQEPAPAAGVRRTRIPPRACDPRSASERAGSEPPRRPSWPQPPREARHGDLAQARRPAGETVARPERPPTDRPTRGPRASPEWAGSSDRGRRAPRARLAGRFPQPGPVTGPEAARVTPPRQRPPPRPRTLIGRHAPHVTTGTSRF